jgi:hypothetical protein
MLTFSIIGAANAVTQSATRAMIVAGNFMVLFADEVSKIVLSGWFLRGRSSLVCCHCS